MLILLHVAVVVATVVVLYNFFMVLGLTRKPVTITPNHTTLYLDESSILVCTSLNIWTRCCIVVVLFRQVIGEEEEEIDDERQICGV